METMYERIKRMSESEMESFIYWVYMCGNEDAKDNYCDSPGKSSFFGGYMLTKETESLMPNDSVKDVWKTFEGVYGK